MVTFDKYTGEKQICISQEPAEKSYVVVMILVFQILTTRKNVASSP